MIATLLAVPFVLFGLWLVLRACVGAVSARYGERDGLRYAAGFLVAALVVVMLLIVAHGKV